MHGTNCGVITSVLKFGTPECSQDQSDFSLALYLMMVGVLDQSFESCVCKRSFCHASVGRIDRARLNIVDSSHLCL